MLMKKLFSIITILISLVVFACKGDKTPVVEMTVHVWGNNENCKATIENASHLEGVSEADWNIDSKLLKLRLDTSVVNVNTVLQAVAKAGYDNEKFFADDYAYNKLPESCQYERRPFESK
jgi:mercuric ion binding protein